MEVESLDEGDRFDDVDVAYVAFGSGACKNEGRAFGGIPDDAARIDGQARPPDRMACIMETIWAV